MREPFPGIPYRPEDDALRRGLQRVEQAGREALEREAQESEAQEQALREQFRTGLLQAEDNAIPSLQAVNAKEQRLRLILERAAPLLAEAHELKGEIDADKQALLAGLSKWYSHFDGYLVRKSLTKLGERAGVEEVDFLAGFSPQVRRALAQLLQ